ncbi:hypothetical protein NEOLEDRAFT_522991 [Neolentinus lepideus HHB14362 ss-1]|uniref:Uncharacterized protein n=1 Tax=Neolentinus lepideus HHB14362 ss-1 TaxID=1314782 RepID=A0A165RCL0_9AGAM|nr:hypothetical protein NEOLEDRAFT_522991 [Neolentinus lepideus HHB14362 ss-1]
MYVRIVCSPAMFCQRHVRIRAYRGHGFVASCASGGVAASRRTAPRRTMPRNAGVCTRPSARRRRIWFVPQADASPWCRDLMRSARAERGAPSAVPSRRALPEIPPASRQTSYSDVGARRPVQAHDCIGLMSQQAPTREDADIITMMSTIIELKLCEGYEAQPRWTSVVRPPVFKRSGFAPRRRWQDKDVPFPVGTYYVGAWRLDVMLLFLYLLGRGPRFCRR